MILRCADGLTNKAVASELGVHQHTVGLWRRRFLEDRIDGLSNRTLNGPWRPLTDEKVAEIVERTLHTTPAHATRWSVRSMARETGVSHMSVRRIWTAFGLHPDGRQPFAFSIDPLFADKVREIVGLHLSRSGRAMVVCVDRSEHPSRTQALDHTQWVMPMATFVREWRSFDRRGYDTKSLLAALNAATGFSKGEDCAGDQAGELLRFLEKIDRRVPDELALHIAVDSAAHKIAAIETWLAQHSRWQVDVAQNSTAWAHQVERWFAELTRKELQHGTKASTLQLKAKIRDFVEAHPESPKPFEWTQSATIGESPAKLEGEPLDSALWHFQQTAMSKVIVTFARLDRAALEQVVQALRDARHVLVVGTYATFPVAGYMSSLGLRNFRNWHLVEQFRTESERFLVDLAADDVVVGIESNPRGSYTLKVAQYARRAGARVIGITDWPEAPLATCANDVLLVSNPKFRVIESQVATLALVEALVTLVAARSDGRRPAALAEQPI